MYGSLNIRTCKSLKEQSSRKHISCTLLSTWAVQHFITVSTLDYWGEPERAPHLSNGVPHDLYMFILYVIP